MGERCHVREKEESRMTLSFSARSVLVPLIEFWNMAGRDRFGGENRKFWSLQFEIRYPSENVELAVEYICLEFRAEIRMEV